MGLAVLCHRGRRHRSCHHEVAPGQLQQQAFVSGPDSISDRQQRDLANSSACTLVAMLTKVAREVQRRETLGIGGHLLVPTTHARRLQRPGHRRLPPLVLGGHVAGGLARVEHARLIDLADELANAAQLPLGLADEVFVAQRHGAGIGLDALP